MPPLRVGSGTRSESDGPVISKQGKAGLHFALVQAAVIASYKDAAICNDFTRLLKGRELGQPRRVAQNVGFYFRLKGYPLLRQNYTLSEPLAFADEAFCLLSRGLDPFQQARRLLYFLRRRSLRMHGL